MRKLAPDHRKVGRSWSRSLPLPFPTWDAVARISGFAKNALTTSSGTWGLGPPGATMCLATAVHMKQGWFPFGTQVPDTVARMKMHSQQKLPSVSRSSQDLHIPMKVG